MLCPVCRHDNFEGEDYCENCGADLAGGDTPEAAIDFQGRLLGEHLDALEVGRPAAVDPGTSVHAAIERMHGEGLDCLLVESAGRLVGIFTERDAVLKVAGKPAEAFDVREVMTPDPVVLRRDDTLAVAIHKMAVGGFRHIPIMDGEAAVGVVTARDVFRHILEVIG
jgi:CBS domain-containing protein